MGGGLKLQLAILGGGLKTETGNFLLHFQNSKSSNRCRSVYGTDIISPTDTKYHVQLAMLGLQPDMKVLLYLKTSVLMGIRNKIELS